MTPSPLRHLVTGGAGFVGSTLVDRLMEAGEEVICLDNYYTGSKANVARWIGHPHFELIRHDVTEPIRLEVDRIWHLACPASPRHYQSNPIKTAKTSFLGTYNMLGMARRVGARLLLASTSEVYGDPEVHPQPESYRGSVNPIGIRSCYDEGKRIAEALCFDYMRMHGTEIRVARIFNTYGPRMFPDDGRVVSNFIVQALRGQPLTLYGDGSQTRSFCYVDDLVEGLIRLMNGNHTGPINIGNPGEFTIRQLAELVLQRINPELPLTYLPLPQDDPLQRQPVIDLARAELGWEPQVSLEDGLGPTIAHFRSVLGLEKP
ncbi:UDP-glucuronic acid decarboxylase family protein [Synechococcus sp. BA-124 BA4]|jgi:UDP-glucuronate decarboxylase|uniref:UDP-glucuronic acid decarboxylase family protein n=1 Tax=unclassified Synechococcus TaxID=2626047 RepID=UPI0018CC8D21|nr:MULTISPECIES: UDP-glucuronic acid decarboxylase family protein [unclassified Synechococcus]MEA5400644.1 UDP-glucuronic acid decarboxylase family protein [Synechococcus sp. BA-124 BA4]QPN55355.1 SDR family oxidoreductase [Synechococcus sp. CBW1107]CAK6689192.1 UDP-glucose 4-epimerase [Synechococcus sp. CBW1107]